MALVVLSAPIFGQTWDWAEKGDHLNAVVQVEVDGATGTGVLVSIDHALPVGNGYLGTVLTASHVAPPGSGDIRVEYFNGRRGSRCKRLEHDEDSDAAILLVWVPKGVKPCRVGKPVGEGELLTAAGLGRDAELEDLRYFRFRSSQTTNAEEIFADCPLLPGDSGGPIFNSEKEVVGVLSGGWFWIKAEEGNWTWPLRGCNAIPLQALIDEVNE